MESLCSIKNKQTSIVPDTLTNLRKTVTEGFFLHNMKEKVDFFFFQTCLAFLWNWLYDLHMIRVLLTLKGDINFRLFAKIKDFTQWWRHEHQKFAYLMRKKHDFSGLHALHVRFFIFTCLIGTSRNNRRLGWFSKYWNVRWRREGTRNNLYSVLISWPDCQVTIAFSR